MYLLDTCLISELVKAKPNKHVVQWLRGQSEFDCYLSVLTLGELEKGIGKLPTSKKRTQLETWLHQDVRQRFQHRILNISSKTAEIWGKLQAVAENTGQTLPVIDGLLAATAKQHQMTLVTRNIKDFKGTELALLNPWEMVKA
ncbi:MAG: VapC toxin family PIN domain ribonuclease [Legionellaceae bacterium]|nr:VapC toxin family PIN domain ribonuclease [Legionellaceae bacterium]|tara:strand:- start:1384 stop:1812 length:429 start_codon:yes stop_codon:yes gene_type:complete